MGDFNINLINYTSHASTENFVNTMCSYFCTPHILKPTRITGNSATLIDNIFFNSIKYHTVSGNILTDISDHLPNFLIIDKLNALPKHFIMYQRDYSNLDEIALIDKVSFVNRETICTSNNDVNEIFQRFYSTITQIIDKHAPVKKLSKKQIKFKSKPWITKGIKIFISTKNKLFKRDLKTKKYDHQSEYKKYRNKLSKLLKLCKEKYYNNCFTKNSNNVKAQWKGIKELISFKNKNSTLLPRK